MPMPTMLTMLAMLTMPTMLTMPEPGDLETSGFGDRFRDLGIWASGNSQIWGLQICGFRDLGIWASGGLVIGEFADLGNQGLEDYSFFQKPLPDKIP